MPSLLLEEHQLLGARSLEDPCVPCVGSYGHLDEEAQALREGVALADLSGMGSQLVSGASASHFVSAALAGEPLTIGEARFMASLTGDGAVASVPLVARTGDEEYLCWDLGKRRDVLFGWLGFLAAVEQGGVKAFDDVVLEDVAENLVPMLLAGPLAPAILADYLGEQPLPQEGMIASMLLDSTRCIVSALPLHGAVAYVVLVPPRLARIFWRSFLSFKAVVPVGSAALLPWLADLLPWFEQVGEELGKLTLGAEQLSRWGLIRADATFVGARGLI